MPTKAMAITQHTIAMPRLKKPSDVQEQNGLEGVRAKPPRNLRDAAQQDSRVRLLLHTFALAM